MTLILILLVYIINKQLCMQHVYAETNGTCILRKMAQSWRNVVAFKAITVMNWYGLWPYRTVNYFRTTVYMRWGWMQFDCYMYMQLCKSVCDCLLIVCTYNECYQIIVFYCYMYDLVWRLLDKAWLFLISFVIFYVWYILYVSLVLLILLSSIIIYNY